jgi:nicotinate-nucleotide adenylyltransferase
VIGQKIGLLGGTFDPVHYGHLQFAEAALQEYRLDKVVFLPSADPPHKNGASITAFRHRLAMLILAGQGRQGFECNAIEERLGKPSYTIDTLRELQKHYKVDCRLYFMIGADAFLDFLTWKSHQHILQAVDIIIALRKGYNVDQLTLMLKKLGYKANDGYWTAGGGKQDIHILQRTPDAHSSSAIREMIAKGALADRFLPEAVIEYIRKNKLYDTTKGARKTS